MMKRFNSISLAIILLVAFTSFTAIIEKEIPITESEVTWKGYKVTGQHEGTLNMKSGALIFENDKLTGGNFTIDMTSLAVTDLPVQRRGRLENHLKSDDFFSVENHPLSSLVITSVEGDEGEYSVQADLSIKGITNQIRFNMNISGNKATADLKVDRTRYDIKFRSASFFEGLKDKAISDEFEISVNLTF